MSNHKTILFRADASSTVGTGHIMRDLVLAKQYPNDKIYFATRDLEGNLNDKIRESGYEVINLKSNDVDELDKIIKKLDIDLLIIDHYEIDYNFEKKLKTQNSTLKIMVFDDTYERHYCDIVLNHNIYADKKRYKELVPDFCELRCGAKYTLIRCEFVEEKKQKREKIYDFFIAMGGADTANLTPKILNKLPKDTIKAILTTSANKHLKELQDLAQNDATITLYINSNKVAKLFSQSKYGIITPSAIVHEVLFMGVAFCAIQTAQNQSEMVKYLQKQGYMIFKKIEEFYCK